MNNDLNQFLSLLKTNERNLTFYPKKILSNLKDNPEAFIFFYEHLSENQKPQWKEQEKNIDYHFREELFNVITQLDDERFNFYFFQGFEKLASLELMRKEANKRLKNKKYQDFIEDFDRPKRIDQVINALSTYYGKNISKFNSLLKLNKENLKKIKLIEKSSSNSWGYFSFWLNRIRKEEGLFQVVKICQLLDFELVPTLIKIKRHMLKYEKIEDILLEENIKGLESLFIQYPQIDRYQIFKHVFGIQQPLRDLRKLCEIDKKWYQYFSPMVKEGIIHIVKTNEYLMNIVNTLSLNINDSQKLLETFKDNGNFTTKFMLDIEKKDRAKFLEDVELYRVWDMEMSLESKEVVSKMKI